MIEDSQTPSLFRTKSLILPILFTPSLLFIQHFTFYDPSQYISSCSNCRPKSLKLPLFREFPLPLANKLLWPAAVCRPGPPKVRWCRFFAAQNGHCLFFFIKSIFLAKPPTFVNRMSYIFGKFMHQRSIGYPEKFLLHPTRRQNFAGKLQWTLGNIWDLVLHKDIKIFKWVIQEKLRITLFTFKRF